MQCYLGFLNNKNEKNADGLNLDYMEEKKNLKNDIDCGCLTKSKSTDFHGNLMFKHENHKLGLEEVCAKCSIEALYHS